MQEVDGECIQLAEKKVVSKFINKKLQIELDMVE
jgi:hypothetical protein